MSFPTTGLWLPVLVAGTLLAFFAALWLLSRNYLKVSPNAVAVLSGRKRKLPDGRVVGYRMVKGGAALRIPLTVVAGAQPRGSTDASAAARHAHCGGTPRIGCRNGATRWVLRTGGRMTP